MVTNNPLSWDSQLCLYFPRLSGEKKEKKKVFWDAAIHKLNCREEHPRKGQSRELPQWRTSQSELSVPCSHPCCTWICFQETLPLPWGHQDLLLLPQAGCREAGSKNPAGEGERLLATDGPWPFPCHPGEKGVRLDETGRSS